MRKRLDRERRWAEGFEIDDEDALTYRGPEAGPDGTEEETDGNADAWTEPGSDERMDFSVLVQVRQLSALADAERERKILRRGE